jgi:hypothetical protein
MHKRVNRVDCVTLLDEAAPGLLRTGVCAMLPCLSRVAVLRSASASPRAVQLELLVCPGAVHSHTSSQTHPSGAPARTLVLPAESCAPPPPKACAL